MEREFLEGQLAAGRSLEQIGALVNKHPSTVGYWVKKYGLVAANHQKNAPKGTLDPVEFAQLVARGLTAAELAKKLELSTTTVNYWLRKLGLRTKRGDQRAKWNVARSAGLQVVHGYCGKHGHGSFKLNAAMSYKCVQCSKDAVAGRRRRVKRILVAEAGGCCRRCGFAEHPAALQFHHVDPTQKTFGLSSAGVSRSLERSREEAQKCVLLCSNCHALVEAGVASV
jgi:DNA-directed RNA polymerase subunit RPC12/RpoP